MTSSPVAQAITALFVPGDRPERFSKAAGSGAGLVIVDLEDAVPPESKPRALATVLQELAPGSGTGLQALVRINPWGAPNHKEEAAALLQLSRVPGNGLLGLMVPKAENPRALAQLCARLPEGLGLVPLIESAQGLTNALAISRIPGVTRLAFGALDFLLDTNATDDRFLDGARAHLVVASRTAGIAAPLDSPSTDIKCTRRVSESAKLARGFGFGGKLCIHPAQVPVVREAFLPSPQDIAWARSVIDASRGAAQVDGQMVDKPVLERARRILTEATQPQ